MTANAGLTTLASAELQRVTGGGMTNAEYEKWQREKRERNHIPFDYSRYRNGPT